MSKRLFIAINIPKEAKEKISKELLPSLSLKGIKAVEKENLHITLLFLGNTDEEKEMEIIKALEKICFSPFKVRLKGFSHFNGRVLFMKAEEGESEITELSRKISSVLGADEECKAHLTLARNKFMGKKDFYGIVEKLNRMRFELSFDVVSFELMESRLSLKGPEYFVLFSKAAC